jgi:Na+/H+ antiporter NhaD/arsenite permease-like protein
VLGLVRQRYPDQHHSCCCRLLIAVFMAPGVAPFVVSNPMNMIVPRRRGLNFNAYAAQMVPISIAVGIIAFVILWGVVRLDAVSDQGPTR